MRKASLEPAKVPSRESINRTPGISLSQSSGHSRSLSAEPHDRPGARRTGHWTRPGRSEQRHKP